LVDFLSIRFGPDSKKMVIDLTHDGIGRQMYLIDIKNAFYLKLGLGSADS
jgi:hypothetical protein